MKKIVEASEEELALCPGLGPQKVSLCFGLCNYTFGIAHSVCGCTCGWQIKLCDLLLICAIPERFTDEYHTHYKALYKSRLV